MGALINLKCLQDKGLYYYKTGAGENKEAITVAETLNKVMISYSKQNMMKILQCPELAILFR